MDLVKKTIPELIEGLSSKAFSAVELTQSYFQRIKATDEKLNSFITLSEDMALEEAMLVDALRANDEKLSPLAGIGASIKDIIATKGVKTTACSKILENYIAPYDATGVARLKERGMIMLGKNNCDEFAHGASTEYSAFKTSHNPWDLERVPGGSSGGSASAVAGLQCAYSMGTDTGGSIRLPAAFTGLTSLKPTYGRVSRRGLFAMTSSTDCLSPIAKTAEGLAYIMEAIAGKDPLDATTLDVPVANYHSDLANASLKGMKIGVPKEYFIEGMNDMVRQSVEAAVEQLKNMGAEIKEISLPHTKYGVAVYYIITPCEVSSNLARFDGVRYGLSKREESEDLIDQYLKTRKAGFGDETKRRIMLGTFALSSGYYDAYYKKASQVRTLVRQDFDNAFKDVDLIITPSSPNVAFKLGELSSDPLKMYLQDVFMVPSSLAGMPAINLPCGLASPDEDDTIDLPVGMQFIAPQFNESRLLQAAHLFQKETDWHKKVLDLQF